MDNITQQSLQEFLAKEVDILTSDLRILSAMLEAPSLHAEVITKEQMQERFNRVSQLSQQFGYFSGKLDAFKQLKNQFLTVKQ